MVLGAALAQIGVAGWRILGAEPEHLLRDHLVDDAFYYFVIAGNLPNIEATPGITTTGFHPLYLGVLAPVFRVFSGWSAVRVAMLVLVAGQVAAGLLLYAHLRRRWRDLTAASVALIWITSAEVRTLALFGVESALVAVALFGLLLVCDDAQPRRPSRLLAVGVVAGCACLARSDAVVLVVPLVLAWWWRGRRDGGPVRVGGLAVVAVGALALLAPWLVFLGVNGSLPLPDSARALPLLPGREAGPASAASEVATGLADLVASLATGTSYRPTGGASWAVLALATLLAAGAVLVGRRRWTAPEWTLLGSVPVLFVLYVAVLKGMREWYLVYALVLGFVVLMPPLVDAVWSVVARAAAGGRPSRMAWSGAAVLLGAWGVLTPPAARYPQEAAKYRAAKVAAGLVPQSDTIGSFNSGIYQFVLADRRVVNLDGVVNPVVQSFRANDALCAYLARERVAWLLDSTEWVQPAIAGGTGVRAVEVVELEPAAGGFGPQVLARIDLAGCG